MNAVSESIARDVSKSGNIAVSSLVDLKGGGGRHQFLFQIMQWGGSLQMSMVESIKYFKVDLECILFMHDKLSTSSAN